MKYKIKTKNENGIVKIDSKMHSEDKRKTIYLVINEKGQIKEVDKKWIVSNIDNIVNLGLSGNSLYLKSGKEKTGNKKEFEKKSLKSFEKEMFDMIEKALPNILKENGLEDITITSFGGGATYPTPNIHNFRFVAKNRPYKFEKGYLALLCFTGRMDNSEYLSLTLTNQNDRTINYLNGGSLKTNETIKTLIKTKRYKLAESIPLVSPYDYNVSHHPLSGWDTETLIERYQGNLYTLYLPQSYEFIDETVAHKMLEMAIKSIKKYIKENKEILQKKLYQDYVEKKPIEKKPVEIPYVIVESSSGMWKFPSGSGSVAKAMELEKKKYKIIVNGRQMSASDFKEKCHRELHNSGTCMINYYSSVSEYVDEKNKIFYCKLGKICVADLWC